MSTLSSAAKPAQASLTDAQSPLSQTEANALVARWMTALDSACDPSILSEDDRQTLKGEFAFLDEDPSFQDIGAMLDQYPKALTALETLCKQLEPETAHGTEAVTDSMLPDRVSDRRVERLTEMVRRFEARDKTISRLNSGKARMLDVQTALGVSELSVRYEHLRETVSIYKAVLRSVHAGKTTLIIDGKETGCLFTQRHAPSIDNLLTSIQNKRLDALASGQAAPSYDGMYLADWQNAVSQLHVEAMKTLEDEFVDK